MKKNIPKKSIKQRNEVEFGIDNALCTTKVYAKVDDVGKRWDQFVLDRFGKHISAILRNLRQPIMDIDVLVGL